MPPSDQRQPERDQQVVRAREQAIQHVLEEENGLQGGHSETKRRCSY
jgi:hypothetical protein